MELWHLGLDDVYTCMVDVTIKLILTDADQEVSVGFRANDVTPAAVNSV